MPPARSSQHRAKSVVPARAQFVAQRRAPRPPRSVAEPVSGSSRSKCRIAVMTKVAPRRERMSHLFSQFQGFFPDRQSSVGLPKQPMHLCPHVAGASARVVATIKLGGGSDAVRDHRGDSPPRSARARPRGSPENKSVVQALWCACRRSSSSALSAVSRCSRFENLRHSAIPPRAVGRLPKAIDGHELLPAIAQLFGKRLSAVIDFGCADRTETFGSEQ